MSRHYTSLRHEHDFFEANFPDEQIVQILRSRKVRIFRDVELAMDELSTVLVMAAERGLPAEQVLAVYTARLIAWSRES